MLITYNCYHHADPMQINLMSLHTNNINVKTLIANIKVATMEVIGAFVLRYTIRKHTS
jgi:hypothetical protein